MQSMHDPDLESPQPDEKEMDSWRLALLGDGGVGKTALAVQVCPSLKPLYSAVSLVGGGRVASA